MRKSLFILCVALALLAVGSLDAAKNNRRRSQDAGDFDDDEFSEFDSSDEESGARGAAAAAKKQQSQPEAVKKQPDQQQGGGDDGFDELVEDEFEENDAKRDEPVKKSEEKASSASSQQQKQQASHQSVDDLDMEEFEHFVDDEEFENFDGKPAAKSDKSSKAKSSSGGGGSKSDDSNKMPNLKITDVPTHLLSANNWHNYVWEIVALVLIAIYFVNFIYGKSKNYKFVKAWIGSHYDILEKNFALVGDNGTSVEIAASNPSDPIDLTTKLIKDSDSCYGLWCSGRQSCDGCMIQLKLVKRQDLINGVVMQLLKPQSDQIVISVEYPSQDDIDSFVFCLSQKKAAAQLFNDMQDLNTFCSEKKLLPTNTGGSSAGLSIDYKYADFLSPTVASKYVLLNELSEVPNIVMDASLCKFMSKYPEMIEYLLISDQFVGIKTVAGGEDQQQAATPAVATTNGAEPSLSLGIPKSRAILVLCLNIPGKGFNTTVEDIESMQPALQLAMYLIDKASRVKLSRESKAKALKKRKEVTEQYMKYTNKQRQEAAQLRKEEKRRAEKDRIMNESDPEKQRRLEEKDQKREKKKSLSKFKQVKIKSM